MQDFTPDRPTRPREMTVHELDVFVNDSPEDFEPLFRPPDPELDVASSTQKPRPSFLNGSSSSSSIFGSSLHESPVSLYLSKSNLSRKSNV